MINREDVDNLLAQIGELERFVSEVRDKDVIPTAFFGSSIELIQQISKAVYGIEQNRVYELEKVLENQRSCIEAISNRLKEEEQKVEALTLAQEAKEAEIEAPSPIEEVVPIPEIKPEPIVLPQEEKEAKAVIAPKKEEKSALSLKEVLEKKSLSDFRKSFSLNDRFLFKKELFGGDEAKMSKTISELNETGSLQEAIDYIQTKLKWDFENSVVADFIARLEKRFL